jgi:hypothetical protein
VQGHFHLQLTWWSLPVIRVAAAVSQGGDACSTGGASKLVYLGAHIVHDAILLQITAHSCSLTAVWPLSPRPAGNVRKSALDVDTLPNVSEVHSPTPLCLKAHRRAYYRHGRSDVSYRSCNSCKPASRLSFFFALLGAGLMLL